MLRALVAVIAAGAVVAGAMIMRERATDAQRVAAAAALRTLSGTQLAPDGSAPQAGISARTTVEVKPFPPRLARQLGHDADFHRLHHRCGVCHATPDPSIKTVVQWDSTVARMRAHIRDAGLLPLGSDEEAVRRILQKYSK